MAYQFADGISLSSVKFLDIRQQVKSLADLQANTKIKYPQGYLVYAKAEDKYYINKSTTPDDISSYVWEEFSSGSGGNNLFSVTQTELDAIKNKIKDDRQEEYKTNTLFIVDNKNLEFYCFNDDTFIQVYSPDEIELPYIKNNGKRDDLFACGFPIYIEPNTGHKFTQDEDETAIIARYSYEGEYKYLVINEDTNVFGGYGETTKNIKRVLPFTSVNVKDCKIRMICAGNSTVGIIGKAEVNIDNCEIAYVGGGYASNTPSNIPMQNVIYDCEFNINNLKGCTTLFGGGNNGYCTVHNTKIIIDGADTDINYVTLGGSNGFTHKATAIIKNGTIDILQTTNRGVVEDATILINGGTIDKLYNGGEEGDSTVNGRIYNSKVLLNYGTVNSLNYGSNGGIVKTDFVGQRYQTNIITNNVIGLEQVDKEIVLDNTTINTSGGDINKIESISKNGILLPINNKKVDITFKVSEIDNDLKFIEQAKLLQGDNVTLNIDSSTNEITISAKNGLDIVTKYSELPDTNTSDMIFYIKTNETISDVEYIKGFYLYSKETNSYYLVSNNNETEYVKTISVNGTNINMDEDNNVDITIPTKVSDLQNDSKFVKETDIATTEKVGVVKIDGTTIVATDGVISISPSGLIDDTQVKTDKGYSSSKIDTDFTKKADVLTKTNTDVYTPTDDYNPTTKKYVDDQIALLGAMKIKGRVDTINLLPTDASTNDAYLVGAEGLSSYPIYMKTEDGWINVGSSADFDLTEYRKAVDEDVLLKTKVTNVATMPSASADNLGMVYIDITNDKMYKCTQNAETSAYEWKEIELGGGDELYKGNVTPTDTSLIWLDTSDTTKTLIKVYNETSAAWEVLNSIPTTYVKAISFTNNALSVTLQDDTIQKYPITVSANIKQSTVNGNLVNGTTEVQVYNDEDVMKISDYASTVNDGYVAKSDIAKTLEGLETAQPNQYYGTNQYNELGIFSLPISAKDLQNNQLVLKNVVANTEYNIGLIESDENCTSIIQAYEFIEDTTSTQDITSTMYNFTYDNYYNYNSDRVIIDNGVDLKKKYELNFTENNGLFTSNEINKDDYINGIEVIING